MADFVAVLKKTLDGLGETTPQTRARVYDKARSTIEAKLAAINPAPPQAVADRQRRALEDAIAAVEEGYGRPKPVANTSDPLSELESIFSSIDRNRTQPNHARPSIKDEVSVKPGASAHQVKPTAPAEPMSEIADTEKPQRAPDFAPPEPEPKPKPDQASGPVPDPAPPVPPAPPASPVSADPVAGTDQSADVDFSDEDERNQLADGDEEEPQRRLAGLIAGLVVLVVIGVGGYVAWLNKDAVTSILGKGTETVAVQTDKGEPAQPDTDQGTPVANGEDTGETQKFTQRLLPDGKEVDPGPAGTPATIGEGSSVVALTTPPSGTPAQPPVSGGEPTAPPAGSSDQPAVAVGQKAIYYEERTSAAEGSAQAGSVVWSLVQESPGGDAPPEPAIRAEANIPGKNLQLRMTIRRNADKTLPASHIIEMIFLTPDGFDGGGIDNVLRIAMKRTEQDAGSPLLGIPAKIANGYFLVALNDTKADETTNLALLRNQEWIDIPVIYKSGRRALLTMEKGIPGDKVFDEALKAWATMDEAAGTGNADTGNASTGDAGAGDVKTEEPKAGE